MRSAVFINVQLFPANSENPTCVRNTTFALSMAVPRLVVITTTPLAARAPYMEVDDASFNTEMDSISLGLMVLKSELVMGTPSRINKGAVPELIEFVPRI